jgi:hypothetical protein
MQVLHVMQQTAALLSDTLYKFYIQQLGTHICGGRMLQAVARKNRASRAPAHGWSYPVQHAAGSDSNTVH